MQPVRLTKHHGLGNDFLIALVDSDTDARLRVVAVSTTAEPVTVEASVTMGRVTERAQVPAPPPGYDIGKSAAADIGNPHWVLLVDDASAVDLARLGPQFEHA